MPPDVEDGPTKRIAGISRRVLSGAVETRRSRSRSSSLSHPPRHAGLILNTSQSELRVLTNAELPLTSRLYDIDLLPEKGHGMAPFKGQARLVWSRTANQLSMVLSSWSDFRKQRKPS